MNHARVFKKSSPNGKLTVYVEKRELAVEEGCIQPLQGVLFVDENYARDRKIYGQLVLTFRYGREDEEVMGLRFCNEACLCADQLWPRECAPQLPPDRLTPLQETLARRLGTGAVPFCFNVSNMAPPSVTLLPARNYNGAPIGTNYDLRIFVGESIDQRPHKRSSVRMGMKVYEVCPLQRWTPPHASASKQFLLTEGHVDLEATLDKEVYERGETVNINVGITNNSSKSVKKVKVSVVQFVDVAMFSNGKFKNVVATVNSTEGCPVAPRGTLTKSYSMCPQKGTIKNWIALEEFYEQESSLASSVNRTDGERNVFAIYVSYYVKVKVNTNTLGALGGEVSVKVPFKLMRRGTPSERDAGAGRTAPSGEDCPQSSGVTLNGHASVSLSKSMGNLNLPSLLNSDVFPSTTLPNGSHTTTTTTITTTTTTTTTTSCVALSSSSTTVTAVAQCQLPAHTTVTAVAQCQLPAHTTVIAVAQCHVPPQTTATTLDQGPALAQTTNTIVAQCSVPHRQTSLPSRETSFDLACQQTTSDMGRIRTGFKLLAGGMCRGFSHPSRTSNSGKLNHEERDGESSDSSVDGIKPAVVEQHKSKASVVSEKDTASDSRVVPRQSAEDGQRHTCSEDTSCSRSSASQRSSDLSGCEHENELALGRIVESCNIVSVPSTPQRTSSTDGDDMDSHIEIVSPSNVPTT